MFGMKKLLLSFFSMIVIFSLVTIGNASANEGITIVEEHEVEGDSNASVDFIDPVKAREARTLSPTPSGPQPIGTYGVYSEKYSHSTYTYNGSTINSYNVGPISSQAHLISVAKGQTKTLSSSTSISGTVSYAVTVEASLAKVINLGLTGSATGSISYTYSTSTTYTGPPSTSAYNTRDYYKAIQFDNHKTTVKKYNVYNTYNGSIKTGTVTYYAGLVTTDNVKKPKAITYSRDFNN